MHIAALASNAMRSHYSNYGPGILLCAPTNNVHTYYRMTVRGLGITTTTGQAGSVTSGFGGTSSATPLVAGIAALTISANSSLSALDVISILKRTASKDIDFSAYPKTPPANFDPDTGWDVSPVAPFDKGDFVDNGDADGSWSPWFGHGRVDAEAAVAEALKLREPAGELSFQDTSSPNKSIPDNNATGIKDKITCSDSFSIRDVSIRVDIVHTYIGDLRVSLVSPSGIAVILHDRAGGSANDLNREFTVLSNPGLHGLSGQSSEGDWVLHVQDLARADRGRLTSWSLQLNGHRQVSVSVSDNPGMIIPDNSAAGISRSLNVVETGRLDNIDVDIDITHTYIGDLIVELQAPDSTSVLLHNRSGGSADNIIKTYSLSNTAGLQALRGTMIQGDWQLKVMDRARADQGKLNRWALHLTAM
jgi:subtilisin-like proprotein convertase family protein